MAHGSVPAGPSELYLNLLKGKISPEDYAKKAMKRVHEEMRKPPVQDAARAQRI